MAHWGHFRYGQARYDEPDNIVTTKIKPTHMIDFHKFLTNPLDDPHISMNDLIAFSEDHLARMIKNGSLAQITARIAATTTALTAVEDAFSDDKTGLKARIGRKTAKNAFRDALPASIGKIYGAVLGKFGSNAPEMKDCFGTGRGIFTHCTDGALREELTSLVAGVTKYQTDLGQPAVTDATALLAAWNAVYQPSEESSAAKVTTIAAKNTARANLQLELFLNLLTIAQLFPRQPEKLDVFMQQSLLQPHNPSTPPPAPAPTPPTGSK
jgi:hypothetical protein